MYLYSFPFLSSIYCVPGTRGDSEMRIFILHLLFLISWSEYFQTAANCSLCLKCDSVFIHSFIYSTATSWVIMCRLLEIHEWTNRQVFTFFSNNHCKWKASENWVKTQKSCSSPQKTLVKDERFVQSEEKLEYKLLHSKLASDHSQRNNTFHNL